MIILFIINHSESKQKVFADLKIEKNGDYVLSDLLSNEKSNLKAQNSQLTLQQAVNDRDVGVLTIQPK